jgi:hypothetical protein
MEQKLEREWKSIGCPERDEKTLVMCEWATLSEIGSVLQRTLRQIDCNNPKLAEFGGGDCDWACENVMPSAYNSAGTLILTFKA